MGRRSKSKAALGIGMSLFMSQVPQVALANAEMISNTQIVRGASHAEAKEKLQELLKQDEVLAQLEKWGVSAQEAQERVANLSPAELSQFSSQIEEARAGGNILVTVLLVLLIVFLIQRI